jgi:hypothetical protein
VVWAVEGKYQLEHTTRPLLNTRVAASFISPEGNYYETMLKRGHDSASFQAILPLPYYSVGSEKFEVAGGGVSIFESFRASINLGLPLLASMMSRSRTEHTLRMLELFSSDLTPKSLPAQLPSRKPLLAVVSRLDSLNPAEKALLRRGARLLMTMPRTLLYELPLASFDTQRPEQEKAAFAARAAAMLREGDMWRTAPGAPVVWRSFEQEQAPSRASFTRPGAAHLRKGGVLPLFDGPLPGALPTDTATYELSIWAHAKTTEWLPGIIYRQFSPDGQPVEVVDQQFKQLREISGEWVRFSTVVHLRNPANRVTVEMNGADIVVDDLLIRPRSTNVYWLDQRAKLVLNGFPLHR